MTVKLKTIKIILIILFLLIGIGALLGSIYLIWMTAFAIGWGGGETTILELIWRWNGFILVSIYSFIASFGLVKNKKIGIILGYPVAIGYFLFTLVDLATFNHGILSMQFTDIMWGILFFGLPILMVIGLTKIKKSKFKFKLSEYVISGILTILLFASFYFMFDY